MTIKLYCDDGDLVFEGEVSAAEAYDMLDTINLAEEVDWEEVNNA